VVSIVTMLSAKREIRFTVTCTGFHLNSHEIALNNGLYCSVNIQSIK